MTIFIIKKWDKYLYYFLNNFLFRINQEIYVGILSKKEYEEILLSIKEKSISSFIVLRQDNKNLRGFSSEFIRLENTEKNVCGLKLFKK